MTDFRSDSYCGLYCGACEIMTVYRQSLETGVPARWEDLPQPLQQHLSRAEVQCTGCKTDVLFAGCRRCSIRQCAGEKGVAACVECAEYPCAHVQNRVAAIARIGDVLPHTRVFFRDADMALIRDQGMACWVQDQETRWCCPHCETPFTWYQEQCAECGLELESIKVHNQ
ncbi:MAG: DUF3795 domain-containing protein [Chloroflexi bacterium]|nr:DUF3795 domain-containing protein [Chloroflexota bacterium]MBU1749992.1 DUF3795 domain-containing protein [Chloroflexota bacterium]MBU1878001.1 DUF3795 domain-containing protein [Chloroflexota bacterium]